MPLRPRFVVVALMALGLPLLPAAVAEEMPPPPPPVPALPVPKAVALTGRPLVVKTLRQLRSPFVAERLDAIHTLGRQTDAELVKSLGVPAALAAIARDGATFDRERVESLQALAQLQDNGVAMPDLLDTILTIVDRGASERIRIDALQVLAQVLAAFPTDEGTINHRRRAFDTLTALWNRRDPKTKPAPLPQAVAAALIETVGEFPGVEHERRVGDLIAGALGDRNATPVVLSGALKGLRRIVERSGYRDDKLVERLIDLARTPAENGGRDVSASALGVLEAMAARDRNFLQNDRAQPFRLALYERLHTGEDLEVTAIIRLLMYIPDEQTVEHIIQESRPRPEGEWQLSEETHVALVRSLVECLNPLRRQWEQLQGSRTAANPESTDGQRLTLLTQRIDEIGLHLRGLLLTADVPESLQREAARGLGFWPTPFNIQLPAAALITAFDPAYGHGPDVLQEVEASLHALTGLRFRLFADDDVDEPAIVDVAAWHAWYARTFEDDTI